MTLALQTRVGLALVGFLSVLHHPAAPRLVRRHSSFEAGSGRHDLLWSQHPRLLIAALSAVAHYASLPARGLGRGGSKKTTQFS
ncbi:hypothetical protein F4802DRAFT_548629 [Xylaria palmicola]|nr:hypothetical protein F4802DRAFT_548629 [Xylaria palmicola]